MGIHLLFWLYIALGASMTGFALLRLLGQRSYPTPDVAILLGLSATCCGLGFASLFTAVGEGANIFFVCLNTLIFLRFRREISNWSGLLWAAARTAAPWPGAAALLSLIILAYSVQAPAVYDSALYHVQAIRWIQESSVVPGLGNLHGRFAFNAHFFLLNALFGGLPGQQLYFPVNGFILALFCCRLVVELRNAATLRTWFFYLLLGLLALFALVRICHSPTPDVFVAVLLLYAGLWAFKSSVQKLPATEKICACALIALAPSVKLSAVLAFATIPVFVPWNFKNYLKIATFSAISLAPFLLRNYYLSGYLIFPFPGLDLFNPDWKVPLQEVWAEKRYIETWARMSSYDVSRIAGMGFSDWLPIWWQNQAPIWKIILSGNALLPLLTLREILRKRYQNALLYTAICLNLVFWFISAPDTRFALGFLLLGFALSSAALLTTARLTTLQQRIQPWVLGLVLCGVLAMAMLKIQLNEGKLLRPTGMQALQEGQKQRLYRFNGISIWIPEQGERCFDCPLPCAPEFNHRLEQREGGGFRVKH